MRTISLEYHDVIEPGFPDSSGFSKPSSAPYKLDMDEFQSHLDSIARVRTGNPANVMIQSPYGGGAFPLHLTFDDGGRSALRIAEALDRKGWVGHFFVTTDFIGTHGFLMPRDIRELSERGHVVGSHSCSHPTRMSSLAPDRIFEEWRKSVAVLSDILGTKVSIASIPGGDFSIGVAQGAAAAGISALFTSEPTMHVRVMEGCLILGRYTISHGMSPAAVASIVLGRTGPRAVQFALWNLKKAAKLIGGNQYIRLRRFLSKSIRA